MFERLDVRMEIKAVDEQGVFEGYASVFDVEDLQGDIVRKGAFKRTIDHSGGRVPILWQHNPDEPIGLGLEMVEDDHGLRVKGQLNLEVQRAREVYALMKQGAIRGLSIGYQTVKEAWESGRRILQEIRLLEYSPVVFPANQLARVTGVKAVVPFQDLPLAPRDRAWDAEAAVARVRSWAGGSDKESIDWAKYRRAFLWYDSEDPENFGSYKLPIADIIDGRLTAIPRAIFAAAAAIQGARGGVDIPEADKAKVRSHLGRYYAKMREAFQDDSIAPPWEKGGKLMAQALEVKVLSEAIASIERQEQIQELRRRIWQLTDALMAVLDELWRNEESPAEEKLATVDQALEEFHQLVLAAFARLLQLTEQAGAVPAMQFKYGRVLSARNLDLLKRAIEALQVLLDAAESQSDSGEADSDKDKAAPGRAEADSDAQALHSLFEQMRAFVNQRKEVSSRG